MIILKAMRGIISNRDGLNNVSLKLHHYQLVLYAASKYNLNTLIIINQKKRKYVTSP